MHQPKKYEVEQTRRVRVTANTMEDAVKVASNAFATGERQTPEAWGFSEGEVEITNLNASKEH